MIIWFIVFTLLTYIFKSQIIPTHFKILFIVTIQIYQINKISCNQGQNTVIKIVCFIYIYTHTNISYKCLMTHFSCTWDLVKEFFFLFLFIYIYIYIYISLLLPYTNVASWIHPPLMRGHSRLLLCTEIGVNCPTAVGSHTRVVLSYPVRCPHTRVVLSIPSEGEEEEEAVCLIMELDCEWRRVFWRRLKDSGVLFFIGLRIEDWGLVGFEENNWRRPGNFEVQLQKNICTRHFWIY